MKQLALSSGSSFQCVVLGGRGLRQVLAAWTCRDDKGLNGLLLSQNDLHLILRGFTHGGDPYDRFFSCRFSKELSQKRTLRVKTEL